MVRMTNISTTLWSVFLFLLLLTGCAVPPEAPPIASTPIAVLAATDTQTLHPSSTATQIPSPTYIPTATPVPVVRFAVIGDYGDAGPGVQAVSELIDSWNVEFIITTGDNNYPDGAPNTVDANIGQYFHEYIFPYKGEYGPGAEVNRFFPSLGNHDWIWDNAQTHLDYFELPGNERYYTFSWKFIDFFAISSDWAEPDGVEDDSPQAAWLQQALAASDAPWQVVYFHHPPYSSGDHGSKDYMQWPFKEWGADVVLSGHDHHYERLVVDDLWYFIVGLGGGGIYGIYDVLPESVVRYTGEYGAMLVEATPTEMRFAFYKIDGELIDFFLLDER